MACPSFQLRSQLAGPEFNLNSRKIARNDTVDLRYTRELQQFLRARSPPEGFHTTNKKRLSGASSEHSRGKGYFRNLFKHRSLSPELELQLHHPGRSHNCIIVRQEVPGQHKPFYRIVRDSSQIDSLENRSIFKVNYEIPKHDDLPKSYCKKTVKEKKKNRGSTEQESKHARRGHTRLKMTFRLPSRNVYRAASRKGTSVSKRSNEHLDEITRGRSLQRSMPTRRPIAPTPVECVTTSSGLSVARPCNASKVRTPRKARKDDAPQIIDFVPRTPLRASELFRDMQRRSSVKSIASSPGKLQSHHTAKITSYEAGLPPTASQVRCEPLSRGILRKSNRGVGREKTTIRELPLGSTRKLGSPAKLQDPRCQRLHQGSDSKSESIERKSGVPLLSITPESLEIGRSPTIKSQPDTKFPSTTDQRTFTEESTVGSTREDYTNDREAAACFSSASTSFESTTDLSMSLKGIRSDTSTKMPLGFPTTPPPTAPLPPLPTKTAQQVSPTRQSKKITISASRTLSDKGKKKMSPAEEQNFIDTPQKYTHTSLLEDHSPQILPLSTTANASDKNNSSPCRISRLPIPAWKLSIPGDNHEKSELSSQIEWPQPPNSQANLHDLKTAVPPLFDKEDDMSIDCFAARRAKIDSIKRKHLQKLLVPYLHPQHDQSGSTFSQTSGGITTLASDQQESRVIAIDRSINEPDYGDVQQEFRPESRLSFHKPQTQAEIPSVNTNLARTGRQPSYRTIYRSHSTQMSPKTGAAIVADGLSSIPIGHQQLSQSCQHGVKTGLPHVSSVNTIETASTLDNDDDVVCRYIDRMMVGLEERFEQKLRAEIKLEVEAEMEARLNAEVEARVNDIVEAKWEEYFEKNDRRMCLIEIFLIKEREERAERKAAKEAAKAKFVEGKQ